MHINLFQMVNGLHLYSTFNRPMYTFVHSFIHRWQCQPCKVPSCWSGAARVRHLARHLGQVESGIEPPTFRFVDIQSDGVWFLATVALLLAFFELAQLGLFSV